jgi:hypothetical protein
MLAVRRPCVSGAVVVLAALVSCGGQTSQTAASAKPLQEALAKTLHSRSVHIEQRTDDLGEADVLAVVTSIDFEAPDRLHIVRSGSTTDAPKEVVILGEKQYERESSGCFSLSKDGSPFEPGFPDEAKTALRSVSRGSVKRVHEGEYELLSNSDEDVDGGTLVLRGGHVQRVVVDWSYGQRQEFSFSDFGAGLRVSQPEDCAGAPR